MHRVCVISQWIYFFVVASVNAEVTVFFSSNGGIRQGVPLLLSDDELDNGWANLFIHLKTEAPSVVEPQSINEDWESYQLYDRNGLLINGTHELAAYDQKNIYVVPNNRYFIWPHVRLGHRAHIKNILNNDDIVLESLSDSPRLFYIHNLFTFDEADYLIKNALSLDGGNGLLRSTTGTQAREDRDLSNPDAVDSHRTSTNAWDQYSPVAVDIMKRLFQILRIPYLQMQGGGLQIVRYQQKEAYRSHHDYFPFGTPPRSHNFNPVTGGTNRYATIFLYLDDVEEGGQTVFPKAKVLPDNHLDQLDPTLVDALSSHKKSDQILPTLKNLFNPNSWQEEMVKECYSTLSVKPRKATAVLFYSMTPDWNLDPMSLHGGCPVLNGTKWGANAWVWNGPRFNTNLIGNDLDVSFTNKFTKEGKLFWRSTELLTLMPGGISDHHTFHTHTFRFEIDGAPVWEHIMDKIDGAIQNIPIGPVDVPKEHQDL